MGWLSELSQRALVRAEAKAFVTQELAATPSDDLARATTQAVAFAANMARDSGEPGLLLALIGPEPVGYQDAVYLQHMLGEAHRLGRKQFRQTSRLLRQRMGKEAARNFEAYVKAESLGVGLLALRATARIEPKCREFAESASRALKQANLPELVKWSIQTLRDIDALSPGEPLAPEVIADLEPNIWTFLEWYAKPVLAGA